MSGGSELERYLDSLVFPLRVLLHTEEPARVCDAIIKEIESFDKKRLLTGYVDSLAAHVDIPSTDIWRCFSSLIQLRNYVSNNKPQDSRIAHWTEDLYLLEKLAESSFKDILSRDSFNDEFIKAVTDFINTEQSYKPGIMNAVSKYPPFRSLQCRFQITIGRMVLLNAPDVMLQFWLRVGNGDGGDDWTTGIAVETSTSVEDEKIFLMDCAMLSRLIEEIEKIMSVACKLERLHLK
ncbi:hypothetical protein LOAG_17430 [Loa loa]|uniref:COMM domain-containing protein n=1 Tax=Loa loa TaxID=7209 RepID=A0A1S0UI82_LOALO|nr:hypothetical protein LOAG_17430 [Loa loa]EJD75422.1 hypothetical protein LOAG_17430 [Loa loa]